ncbi:MAG: putative Ig domain-containing protein, partial [Gammaproteobacteria bacterium]
MATEDAEFALDVSGNFSDIEGDSLTFSASGLPTNLSISASGVISGTPTNEDVGNYTVVVLATDPSSATATDTFNIEVTNTNDPPEVSSPIGNQSATEGSPYSLVVSGNFSDPDGDQLGFTATGLPDSLTISTGGTISGTPLQSETGNYNITVTASDSLNETVSDSFVLTISNNNDPPELVSQISDAVATEDSPFTLDVSPNFSDPDGDTLSFVASGLPPSLTIDSSGLISGTPLQSDVGNFNITITASDPDAASVSNTFQLTVNDVNDPPQATTPIGDRTAAEDSPFELDLSGYFLDPDGDALVFTATGLPSGLLVDSDGIISGIPGQSDVGVYSVTATATDPSAASANSSFVLTIENVNDSPVTVTPIGDQSAAQNADFLLDISGFFDDEDGDALLFTATGLPASLSISNQGVISGRPLQSDVGPYQVQVTATDPSNENVSQQFKLTVTDVNDPPELKSSIEDQTTAEDQVFILDISTNFEDPEGSALVFTQSGLPSSIVLDPSGLMQGTPVQDDIGVFSVTVTATDPSNESVSDTFTLTVTAVNDPPTILAPIGDQSATQDLDFLLDISTFFDDQDDDELLFSESGLPASFILNESGVISGQPSQSDVGQYQVQITATDPLNESVAQTFTLTVTDVNDPPGLKTPIGDQEAFEDQLFSIDVSASFEDPEGSTLVFTATGLPASIVLETSGLMQGTPGQDDVGIYAVSVTATDPSGESASDTFTMTVTGINDAPILLAPIGDQSATEDVNFALDVASYFDDPDGDVLNYIATGLPASLALSQAGLITGTPPQSEVGDYQVSIEARDPSGERATDSFALSVQAANDSPILEGEIPDQQVVEGAFFLTDLSAFFTDDDGDELNFSAIGLPDSGNISLDAATGVMSGTPLQSDARDFPYEITVTATDPDQASASGEFLLTVAALDRANVSLNIDVTPSPALLIDDTRWTFTAQNSGPSAVQEQLLKGSFTGQQLMVESLPPSDCDLEPVVAGNTAFSCSFGSLANGSTAFVVFSVSTNTVGDILAQASTVARGEQPIDPNNSDNEAQESVSVAESFSNGSVQTLGNSNVRAIAAGDLDGDGDLDLVLGTAAGQPVEVYDGTGYRTFAENPRIVPDNSSTEGMALADLDDDGDLDIVLANTGGQPDRIFQNDGIGNFQFWQELGGTDSRGVAAADFNSDGIPDLVFASVQGNPVYLGDGNGGYTLLVELGLESTFDVAATDLTGDGRPDIVFANVGAPSKVWSNVDGSGFELLDELAIGDSVAVATFDLEGDSDTDLVFARVPATASDIPSNPILANDGNGQMQVIYRLGASPTLDAQAGDVNGDSLDDLVFVNSTGTHQTWIATATGFELYGQQIVRPDSVAGLLADLGNDGGLDLALGGGTQAGVDTYLNDGNGNLGMGDAIPPTIELIGAATLSIAAGTTFVDPGAKAEDNIDGDLSALVRT